MSRSRKEVMKMYFYRVPVVEDEEGRRPDCPPPLSVIEYLDDNTVIVRRPERLSGATELTTDELNMLVKNPIHKILDIAGRLYGFVNREGIVQVGIDRDGIICLRAVETVKIPVAVDADGNVLETREVQRVKLTPPPFDRVLAIRDGRLVVLERTEGGWRIPTIQVVDEQTGEVREVEDPDPEFPVATGGTMRLSEIKTMIAVR